MAKYTVTILSLQKNNFDFGLDTYPIFDENYRETLNNNILNYYLNCFYKKRKEACDILNKKFGTNVEIVLNKEVVDLLAETTQSLKEGVDSGEIHSDNSNSTEE